MKLAYAGSFDPFTNGHLHIIEKASMLNGVEKIVVIVSGNPSKKKSGHFSAEQRVKMITDVISNPNRGDHLLYDVVVLPANEYAVSFARSLGCNAMLRGVRTEPDFQDECGLYQANKVIDPNMETIYMMPDIDLSAVRSSMVMGMVGPTGWTFAVEKLVPEKVMLAICKKFCLDTCGIKDIFGDWSKYDNSPYHNWKHIAYFLTEFIKFYGNCFGEEMFGILLHDLIEPNDVSRRIGELRIAIRTPVPINLESPPIVSAIEITDHSRLVEIDKGTPEILNVIHDIDLSVLAWNEERYRSYVDAVTREYIYHRGVSREDFISGRISFISNMLKRERIFFTEHYSEFDARLNLEREFAYLCDD